MIDHRSPRTEAELFDRLPIVRRPRFFCRLHETPALTASCSPGASPRKRDRVHHPPRANPLPYGTYNAPADPHASTLARLGGRAVPSLLAAS